MRLGLINDNDHMNTKYFYHLDCFRLFPRHKELTEDNILTKIHNMDELEQEDIDKVVEVLKKCIANIGKRKNTNK